MAEVEIGLVTTDLLVQENVGTLSPEEVKRLVAIVLEQVRNQQSSAEQKQHDTKITNRAFGGHE